MSILRRRPNPIFVGKNKEYHEYLILIAYNPKTSLSSFELERMGFPFISTSKNGIEICLYKYDPIGYAIKTNCLSNNITIRINPITFKLEYDLESTIDHKPKFPAFKGMAIRLYLNHEMGSQSTKIQISRNTILIYSKETVLLLQPQTGTLVSTQSGYF